MSAVIEQIDQNSKPVSGKRAGGRGQIGNRHAAKGRDWLESVKWALKKYESNSIKRGRALRQIALKVVEDALEGKEYAIREISERLDGKVSSGEGSGSIRVLVIRDQSQELTPIDAEVTRLDDQLIHNQLSVEHNQDVTK